MLLVYFLIVVVVILFTFSLSRETGKNTKHARKGPNAIVQQQVQHSQLMPHEVSEAS